MHDATAQQLLDACILADQTIQEWRVSGNIEYGQMLAVQDACQQAIKLATDPELIRLAGMAENDE